MRHSTYKSNAKTTYRSYDGKRTDETVAPPPPPEPRKGGRHLKEKGQDTDSPRDPRQRPLRRRCSFRSQSPARESRPPLCPWGAPTLERKAPLTMQEEEGAVRIAQASGIVERINGGQGWMANRVYRTIIAGRDGIQFDAIWDEPVDSAGPWALLQCTGTLRVESSARWRDVTRLVI